MSQITGQAIHKIHEQREPTALPWSLLSDRSKTNYNTIADELNAQHLAPLQGLLRDWQELLQEHDELSVMSILEIDDWHKHWEILKRRSRELLGEEQKEG